MFTSLFTPLHFTYLLFLLTQLYALVVHFPHPSSGSVFTRQLQLLKALTTSAVLLSWFPVATVSAYVSASARVSHVFIAPAYVCMLGSVFLFIWTAYHSGPRNFSIIYGRVTPQFVVQSGPFAHIRHPTYVSYTLGWLGALYVCVLLPAVRDPGAQFWVPDWMIILLLGGCIAGLGKCYADGAKLEEAQFLEGENNVDGESVGVTVKSEYRRYVAKVQSRWIPGVV
jgi:protein-S-isoprenylcysteine O-methyltransferase Ste14